MSRYRRGFGPLYECLVPIAAVIIVITIAWPICSRKLSHGTPFVLAIAQSLGLAIIGLVVFVSAFAVVAFVLALPCTCFAKLIRKSPLGWRPLFAKCSESALGVLLVLTLVAGFGLIVWDWAIRPIGHLLSHH